MVFELRVLSGQNMGAAFPLTKNKYTLSTDVNSDIYIKKISSGEISLILELINDQWILNDSMRGKKVIIDNDEIFKIEGDYYAIKPATSSWGETSLSSGGTEGLLKFTKRFFLILTFILCGSAFFFMKEWGGKYDERKSEVDDVNFEHVGLEGDVIESLRRKLRDYDLHQNLKVVEKGGQLAIEGELLFEQMKRKDKMIELIKKRYTRVIQDNTYLRIINDTPFEIKQIVSSNPAHVVTVNNDYIFVGDEFEGWRLKSVSKVNADFEKIN